MMTRGNRSLDYGLTGIFMNETNAVKNEKSSSLGMLMVMLGVPVLAVLGALYFWQVYKPQSEGQATSSETIEKMIGLSTPIVGGNHLAAQFSDVDGDLVADAPTDASRLVDPPTIFFSYIAQEEPERVRDAWKPFVDYLSKTTGKPVEYKLMTDTVDQLKALSNGELHVCGFNSGAVPTAVDAAGFVPVCLVPSGDGEARTTSAFIVPASSPLQRLDEIRGREITYTYPTSNSGFKAPILTLLEKVQLRPGKDYNINYSQGHEQSIVGIAKKQYEVAAVAKDMLQRALNAGEVKKEQFRVLYESESFPTASMGLAYNLKPELAAKIREALTTFDWKGTTMEKELGSSVKTTFLPVNYKNDFSLLRKIDDVTGTKHEIK